MNYFNFWIISINATSIPTAKKRYPIKRLSEKINPITISEKDTLAILESRFSWLLLESLKKMTATNKNAVMDIIMNNISVTQIILLYVYLRLIGLFRMNAIKWSRKVFWKLNQFELVVNYSYWRINYWNSCFSNW